MSLDRTAARQRRGRRPKKTGFSVTWCGRQDVKARIGTGHEVAAEHPNRLRQFIDDALCDFAKTPGSATRIAFESPVVSDLWLQEP